MLNDFFINTKQKVVLNGQSSLVTIFLLLPVPALSTMYTIKVCQKQLCRNLASVNLKLKNLNSLLRVQAKFFILAFLTFEVA